MAKKEGHTFESVMASLKQGKFEPVYFFCGDEPFFIDKLSNYLAEHALPEHEREFNQSIVYGKDIDPASLMALARQFPMMAERRLVIVREAQEIKKLDEQLAAYVEKPVGSTVLVICHKNGKPDGRGKLAAALKKHTVYFESEKMYDNQLPGWVVRFVEGRGYKIRDAAAQLLADNIGNDLAALANALEKLMILLPAGAEITPAVIEQNIGISKDFNVFELQKAIGEKDILKSNQIARYFAANEKDHPLVMTISILGGFFTKIITFHYLPDKSKFPASAALKINPFFYNDYATAARNYSAAKTLKILEYLREFDLKSKGLGTSGEVSQGDLLKELLFKILH